MNTGIGFEFNEKMREVNYNDLLERIKKGALMISLENAKDLIIVIKNGNEYMFMEESAGGNIITENPYEDMFKEMIKNCKSFVTINVGSIFDGEGNLIESIYFEEQADLIIVDTKTTTQLVKFRHGKWNMFNPEENLSICKVPAIIFK